MYRVLIFSIFNVGVLGLLVSCLSDEMKEIVHLREFPLLEEQSFFINLEKIEELPHQNIPKQMRGVWVATVGNLDWPSAQNLSPQKQQEEALFLLDSFQELGLNAVFLQVRPSGDKFYRASSEPWSSFLNGQQGQISQPSYDPLEFWIRESHKRGLVLYAWLNPFRVGIPSIKEYHTSSLVKKWENKPELIHLKKGYYWLDPGSLNVQHYNKKMVEKLLSSYEIDGLIIDDYFYPYPDYFLGEETFPDSNSHIRWGKNLSLEDFRRHSIEQTLKQWAFLGEKHRVPFGVSPFGIYRPEEPPGIRGLDSYNTLFTNSKSWLEEGLVHYFSPQLYWPTDSQSQNFGKLWDWWKAHNLSKRGLWPSLAFYKFSQNLQEIQKQLNLVCPSIQEKLENSSCGFLFYALPRYLKAVPNLKTELKKNLTSTTSCFTTF